MRVLRCPVVLALKGYYGQHLRLDDPNPFHLAIAVGVVGACDSFANTKKPVCIQCASVKIITADRNSIRRDVPIDEEAGRAFGCEFGSSSSEHVSTTGATLGLERNVGAITGRDLGRVEIIAADRDSGSTR